MCVSIIAVDHIKRMDVLMASRSVIAGHNIHVPLVADRPTEHTTHFIVSGRHFFCLGLACHAMPCHSHCTSIQHSNSTYFNLFNPIIITSFIRKEKKEKKENRRIVS